ncbi:hypothetical protein LCGC14_0903180 [marine sediment metagenome]|uniref:Uncharacterized protein n=1 Tax=marine sediment metagenome TaxID=412755 RepID=A0A0F9REU7_9ZZZZ
MSLTLLYEFAKKKTLAASLGLGPTLGIVRTTNATYFDTVGVLQTAGSGVARFDHDPVTGESLGLFVEKARTNLILRSTLEGGDPPTGWTKPFGPGTAISQASILISGGTAVRFQASTERPYLSQDITLAASTEYTVTVYLEDTTTAPTGSVLIRLGFSDATGDSDKGTTDADANGRISLTFTTGTDVTGSIRFGIGVNSNDSGDIAMSAPQVEAGAFPTSYIPTTTASVTRNADVVSTADVSWFTSATSTIYLDVHQQFDTGFSSIFDLTDNSSSDRYLFERLVGDTARYLQVSATTTVVTLTSGVVFGADSTVRMAATIALNDVEFFVNGTRIGTGDQSAALPVGITDLNVGSDLAEANQFNGHIKELRYYNVRKPNQFLEDLSNGLISAAVNSLIDARYNTLRQLVPSAPPYVNDMLFAWLLTEGGTGNSLTDRWYTMLINKVGVTPGTINDMWFQLLGINGHTQNSLNDRELAFWVSEGTLI